MYHVTIRAKRQIYHYSVKAADLDQWRKDAEAQGWGFSAKPETLVVHPIKLRMAK